MLKSSFLFLIIYMIFSRGLFSQNLTLRISGENEFESELIDSLGYLKTHKDFKSIKYEVDSVQKILNNIGYIENELAKIKKISDSAYAAQIYLKKKYSTIYIYYDKTLVDIFILNLVSQKVFDDYFELPLSEVENALTLINTKISEQGFPFSKLRLSNIEVKESNHLKADLLMDYKEQKRSLNNIVIKGYDKFPKSYLKHYLKIKRTQPFDLNTIKRKMGQLNDLKFANQIKTPEVLFSTDSTTLYMYLEKTKSNSFDGFLGFGTKEGTNKLEFNGYLNLNLTNNLNYGESLRLQYKSDENDQKTFKTHVSLPYIFNLPIGIDLQLYIFKKDSSFTTVNQSAKLDYQINSKQKIYSGITATQSNNLLSDNVSPTITDYNSIYYTFAYQYVKPQSYNSIFPINIQIYLETNFGERKESHKAENQSLFSVDAFKIFNLNKKNSLYVRINGATLNSDSYFENELLRFGGINSMRGFEENSLFASQYGLINTEYRFQLNNAIYLHSIFDASYFENKITNNKEKLFGYGFGFGILTKAGLFKFNYANGKSENQQFKLSNSKIHISLIADF